MIVLETFCVLLLVVAYFVGHLAPLTKSPLVSLASFGAHLLLKKDCPWHIVGIDPLSLFPAGNHKFDGVIVHWVDHGGFVWLLVDCDGGMGCLTCDVTVGGVMFGPKKLCPWEEGGEKPLYSQSCLLACVRRRRSRRTKRPKNGHYCYLFLRLQSTLSITSRS